VQPDEQFHQRVERTVGGLHASRVRKDRRYVVA
jgi:hypothetical protein